MNRTAATGYAIGMAGVILAAFALLAPASIVNAARERVPLPKMVIADEYTERSASVDTRGNLQVKVADPVSAQVTNFPGMQNVKVVNPTLPVEGSVKVSNLPSVQQVTGVVNVGNLPSTQNVSVTNKSLPVSGSVAIANLPAVQEVEGTVHVGNLPATQNVSVTNGVLPVSGSVAVSNLPPVQKVEVANFPGVQAVSGQVEVGNWPRLDASRVVNLYAVVNETSPSLACDQWKYTVPTGQRLLISDFVMIRNNSDAAALWTESRGTVGAMRDKSTVSLTTPLRIEPGETLCVLRAGGGDGVSLFMSGQLVDAS